MPAVLRVRRLDRAGRHASFPLELALLPGLYRRLFDLRLPMASALGLAQTRHRPLTRVQRTLSRLAEPNALRVIRQTYEHEGSAGSWSEDAWVTGLVCTGLARASVGQDMVDAAVGWLRRSMHPDGSWATTPLDAAWTMYAVRGLVEAGYGDDERLVASRDALLGLQQHRPFLAFGCPPGFWGWTAGRGWPAVLETGEIVSVLSRLPGTVQDAAVAEGSAGSPTGRTPAAPGVCACATPGSRTAAPARRQPRRRSTPCSTPGCRPTTGGSVARCAGWAGPS